MRVGRCPQSAGVIEGHGCPACHRLRRHDDVLRALCCCLPRPAAPETVQRLCGVLTQWRTMANFELVTAADVQLMQGLTQRVTAIRPDLVNSDASFGELAWIWGKGHAGDGASWPRRLWFCGGGRGQASAPGEAERRVGEARHRRLSGVSGPSRPRRAG